MGTHAAGKKALLVLLSILGAMYAPRFIRQYNGWVVMSEAMRHSATYDTPGEVVL